MNTKYEKHASWGMVGLYHTQGGGRQLFGSDVSNHNTIRLVIKHAQKHRDLGREWTMGDDTICEVELSALQFAELLTNMNIGDGVSCTIRYTNNDGYVEYQEEQSKLDVIYKERDEIVNRASLGLREVEQGISELINSKKISKSIGTELLHKLSSALSDLEGNNFEFYKKQATEEIDKMVIEAKSQISEYINHKIYSVGLEALMSGENITPMLNGVKK